MATKANITIEQGADFNVPIELLDQNGNPLALTGFFTGTASMKKYYTAANSVMFGVGLANGQLTLSMAAAVSANVAAGRYVYDVILTNIASNVVSRVVEGIVTVTPGVTEPGITTDE